MGNTRIGHCFFWWNCVGQISLCNSATVPCGDDAERFLGSATSGCCVLTDATKVDLSSLPEPRVTIIYDNTNWDEIAACSVSSNTVSRCYDPGRRFLKILSPERDERHSVQSNWRIYAFHHRCNG